MRLGAAAGGHAVRGGALAARRPSCASRPLPPRLAAEARRQRGDDRDAPGAERARRHGHGDRECRHRGPAAGACSASAAGCCAAQPHGRSPRRSTAWSGSVAEPVPRMRFWGWGEDARAGHGLPDHARAVPRRAPRRGGGAAPAGGARAGLAAAAGAAGRRGARAWRRSSAPSTSATTTPNASCTPPARATPTSCGCARARPRARPDAVVLPPATSRSARCSRPAPSSSLAVVPFGGGTSVVGGLAPLRGSARGGRSRSTSARLGGVVSLDAASATVTVGAGMRAPALERELGAHGLTLGHYPQSYEYVSLGGCAATRSAGQASTGYGAIEKMVLGLRLAAPAGGDRAAAAARDRRRARAAPAAGRLGGDARGDQRALAARAPRAGGHAYEGVFFESFEAGREAFRALAAEHALPDVARLSDEAETRMSLALAGSGGAKGRLGRRYLVAARLRAGAALRSSASRGGDVGRLGAPAPRAAPDAPRRRAAGRAPHRGGRGARAASPRRTCATSCSGSA